jgi:putative FmdB family regulatory protein
MPIYEYACSRCGRHIEVLQKVSAPPPKICRSCGGALRKVISAPALQFKGSGWYVTDYARKSSPQQERKTKDKGADKPGGKAAASSEAASPKANAAPSKD